MGKKKSWLSMRVMCHGDVHQIGSLGFQIGFVKLRLDQNSSAYGKPLIRDVGILQRNLIK